MIEDTKSDVVLDLFLLSIATVVKILNLQLCGHRIWGCLEQLTIDNK